MPARAEAENWLRCTHPVPNARLRLFCIPYAGSGASLFRQWGEGLPPEIEVFAVQFPGREGRFAETPFNRLAPLLHILVEALRPWLDVPFAIFGHSLGALIGFELARSLRRSYSPVPERLFVSACPAPQLPGSRAPVHALPDPDFVAGLAKIHSVPPAFLQDPDLLDVFLPLLRSDIALYETYSYTAEEPLACPITAFYGRDDPHTNMQEVAAWRYQTSTAFSLRMIPGDHFFIHTHGQLLIRELGTDLAYPRNEPRA